MALQDAVWLYLVGVAFFLLIADEPWPQRLGLASLWPVAVAIFLLVLAILILAAAVAWWPLGLGLALAAGLIAWWCRG
jgi:hypothetical protein